MANSDDTKKSSQQTLRSLSDEISSLTDVFSGFLESNGHPERSLKSTDSVRYSDAPEDVESARRRLVTKLQEMTLLAMSPFEAVRDMLLEVSSLPALHVISHFEIIDHVPLDREISYAELAQKINVPQRRLTRMLRSAISRSIFQEPKPGYIAHNSLSAAMIHSKWLRYHVASTLENFLPTAPKFVEQIEKFGDRETRSTSAAGIAYNTETDCIQYLLSQPKHQQILMNVMKNSGEISGLDPESLVEHYDWPKASDQIIVDVGGASGSVSRAIASSVPSVRFIVQDRANAVRQGELETPPELKDRFTFQEHDFFQVQPVKNADVYLLRWILHDWPDEDAITILRQVALAMGPKSKMLIAERLVLLPGEGDPWDQKIATSMDMFMMAFNGSERTLEHFQSLVEQTGEALEICRVIQRPNGALYSLIEVARKE
ncbi:MET1_DOTSN ame: Full=Hps1-dma1 cluster O-methyltransferase [Lecanosticta acicola]|uniref:Hps1-dma1 cluster O-methyltransferase n=1 Tax=Lecanosticta acicola TaxID=111012 RepID=A0AAI8YY99_9PEZI|nr:MET1_DOTSN ame: Full=Hps1-dma1 cluster O-methyltransferase [Lecanosticta acicola]